MSRPGSSFRSRAEPRRVNQRQAFFTPGVGVAYAASRKSGGKCAVALGLLHAPDRPDPCAGDDSPVNLTGTEVPRTAAFYVTREEILDRAETTDGLFAAEPPRRHTEPTEVLQG